MKLGIVTPICIQVPSLLEMTYECLSLIKSRIADVSLFIPINRIKTIGKEEFDNQVKKFTGIIPHSLVSDRCVPAGVNWGIYKAILSGCKYILIMSNDIFLERDTLDKLIEYGEKSTTKEVPMWSGQGNNTLGCDFSCMMFRPSMITEHGYFDENFKPEYHEDIDYSLRLYLSGKHVGLRVEGITYKHGKGGKVSQTINSDSEMEELCRAWFNRREKYFHTKWGIWPTKVLDYAKTFKTPYNKSGAPLWYWQEGLIDNEAIWESTPIK